MNGPPSGMLAAVLAQAAAQQGKRRKQPQPRQLAPHSYKPGKLRPGQTSHAGLANAARVGQRQVADTDKDGY